MVVVVMVEKFVCGDNSQGNSSKEMAVKNNVVVEKFLGLK